MAVLRKAEREHPIHPGRPAGHVSRGEALPLSAPPNPLPQWARATRQGHRLTKADRPLPASSRPRIDGSHGRMTQDIGPRGQQPDLTSRDKHMTEPAHGGLARHADIAKPRPHSLGGMDAIRARRGGHRTPLGEYGVHRPIFNVPDRQEKSQSMPVPRPGRGRAGGKSAHVLPGSASGRPSPAARDRPAGGAEGAQRQAGASSQDWPAHAMSGAIPRHCKIAEQTFKADISRTSGGGR